MITEPHLVVRFALCRLLGLVAELSARHFPGLPLPNVAFEDIPEPHEAMVRKGTDGSISIVFSPRVLDLDDQALRDTVAHELVHVHQDHTGAVDTGPGSETGHGSSFFEQATRLSRELGLPEPRSKDLLRYWPSNLRDKPT